MLRGTYRQKAPFAAGGQPPPKNDIPQKLGSISTTPPKERSKYAKVGCRAKPLLIRGKKAATPNSFISNGGNFQQMRVLEDNISLVIAGAWNPAILSPNWIAEKAMDRPVNAEFQVQVALPVMNLGFSAVRPQLAFEGISVCAEPNTLTFRLSYEDVENANLGVTTAARVLELLPHTPVSGFGFNFSFCFDDPNPALLETFNSTNFLAEDVPDDEARLVRQEWRGIVQSEGRLISVGATYEAGCVIFNLNIHTELRTSTEAAERLRENNLFTSMKALAMIIISRFGEQGADA